MSNVNGEAMQEAIIRTILEQAATMYLLAHHRVTGKFSTEEELKNSRELISEIQRSLPILIRLVEAGGDPAGILRARTAEQTAMDAINEALYPKPKLAVEYAMLLADQDEAYHHETFQNDHLAC